PRMGAANAGDEVVVSVGKMLRKVSAENRDILLGFCVLDGSVDGQHGSESGDVVVPEDAFDLRQIGFAQECAIRRRLEIDSADFYIQRVFLRRDDQVRADGAEFAVDLV